MMGTNFMLRKNTNEIISACRQVADQYDELCKGFFGRPGREGIKRKIEFLQIVESLEDKMPDEAFLCLYEFCKKEKDNLSRLIDILSNQLYLTSISKNSGSYKTGTWNGK